MKADEACALAGGVWLILGATGAFLAERPLTGAIAFLAIMIGGTLLAISLARWPS